jgi:hypothetical protein
LTINVDWNITGVNIRGYIKPLIWKPFEKRPAGRLKNRWIDGILKDIQVLKVKNWKELIGNRKEWNNLVEKAKTHPGS